MVSELFSVPELVPPSVLVAPWLDDSLVNEVVFVLDTLVGALLVMLPVLVPY